MKYNDSLYFIVNRSYLSDLHLTFIIYTLPETIFIPKRSFRTNFTNITVDEILKRFAHHPNTLRCLEYFHPVTVHYTVSLPITIHSKRFHKKKKEARSFFEDCHAPTYVRTYLSRIESHVWRRAEEKEISLLSIPPIPSIERGETRTKHSQPRKIGYGPL